MENCQIVYEKVLENVDAKVQLVESSLGKFYHPDLNSKKKKKKKK